MRSEEAEGARRRYLYRRLVSRGALRVPLRGAIPLVGPDCAYHLYAGRDPAPAGRARRGRAAALLAALLLAAAPAGSPAAPAADRRADEPPDVDRHVAALRRRLPAAPAFTLRVAAPYVVVGDGPPDEVARLAEHVVARAAGEFRARFFARDPGTIVDVYLFKDRDSYYRHTAMLTGSPPESPLGFFSSHANALLMDVNAGEGALMHELVHPFVRSNWPRCPPWINEGLATLFEDCRDRGGRLEGAHNGRFLTLLRALDRGSALPFSSLAALSDAAFYNDPTGLHYAQSRYVFFHLQQRGALDAFCRRYAETSRDDPTGGAALADALKIEGPAEFDRAWRAAMLADPWAARLRAEGRLAPKP